MFYSLRQLSLLTRAYWGETRRAAEAVVHIFTFWKYSGGTREAATARWFMYLCVGILSQDNLYNVSCEGCATSAAAAIHQIAGMLDSWRRSGKASLKFIISSKWLAAKSVFLFFFFPEHFSESQKYQKQKAERSSGFLIPVIHRL